MSNMKQIGTAIISFAGDHDGSLPGPTTGAVYSWAWRNPPLGQVATLGNYLGDYVDAKPYDPSSPDVGTGQYNVGILSCPALPNQARAMPNGSQVANFCMMDISSAHPNYTFGGKLPATPSLAGAATVQPQPKRLAALTDIERRTAFLSTADYQIWPNTPYGLLLTTNGVFNGKRLWLFMDGSVQLNGSTTNWVR